VKPRRRRPLSPRELRERRSSRNLRLATVGVGVVALLAVGGVLVATRVNPPLGDDLCPADREPAAEVVVLLDATDPWNATQRAAIRGEFERIRNAVPRFARVRLFALEESLDGLPTPAVALCNPGTENDFASVPVLGRLSARFFANPARLEQWRGGFETALDDMLSAVADDAGGRASPIMETVRGIALEAFPTRAPVVRAGTASGTPRPGDVTAADRRLYVFSDMLQHTDAYSHYRASAWSTGDAERLADVAAAGTARLGDVAIEIFLLDRGIRGEGRGPGALAEFWEAWFAEQGAVVERVRRMEG